jgi:multiple sugar transport system permease protein
MPPIGQNTQQGVIAGATRPRRDGALSAWAERHFKWLIVLPAVLLILALSVYPLLFSLWVAFVNYDFEIPGHDFVGLQNFVDVLSDPIAPNALLLTVVLSVVNVAIEFLLGLALALALVKTFRGRGIVMSILIVPLFISPVIVGQSWALFLQRPFGPADYLLGLIFGHPVTISWLTESPWVYLSIVIADVWQWTPFMFVILLAGLAAIPPHLYEAAELDGVSRLQAFFYVTLPQLAPIMVLAITFRLLDAVRLFDVIYMMTGGGPGTKTYTLSYYLYQTGFQQFHLSVATAGSWIFLILLSVVIALLVRRLLRAEKS